MEKSLIQFLLLILYWYYIEENGVIEKGAGKRIMGFGISVFCLTLSLWMPFWCAWGLVLGVLALYDLFFDEEPFSCQWRRVLLPGSVIVLSSLLPSRAVFSAFGGILFLFFLLLSKKRDSLGVGNGILTGAAFFLISLFLWMINSKTCQTLPTLFETICLWGGIALEILLFLITEGTLFFYQKGYETRSEQFRTHLLEHSYGEIREIYMDMRGWRHDYHNHMQVLKAQASVGDTDGILNYLDQLEKELDRVDTLVKSGNPMADAILNSKLTLARRQKISVNCKALLPKQLPVEDVDLCMILGNLLDNAIEACSQIGENHRFLRIYMTVNKSQLYLSIQNSAKEEPDFNEKNYISKKRGNHGLGMKRVKTAVDKYDGYLNLANEPGIFAAEVTLPLPE